MVANHSITRLTVVLLLADGSVALAGKAAGHELKSLSALLSTGVPLVHYPVQQVVDYRGFRVSMTQLLPGVDRSTLKYGSMDQGRTIETDPSVVSPVEELADNLNLKQHMTQAGVNVCMPVDLEVHRAPADGRAYLVDTARLMPAAPPSLVARSMLVLSETGHVQHAKAMADSAVAIEAAAKAALGSSSVTYHVNMLGSGVKVCVAFKGSGGAIFAEPQNDDGSYASSSSSSSSSSYAYADTNSYSMSERAMSMSYSYAADSVGSDGIAADSETGPAPEPAGQLNALATRLAGRPVAGPAAVFFNVSSHCRHMYQLLRPEAVLAARPTKLSSDAIGPTSPRVVLSLARYAPPPALF